uniref:Uncharacterized protein n=1 Tax=Anguilla anguilla TaxID=7936 RepID=A0A0E9VGN3_ANGAN
MAFYQLQTMQITQVKDTRQAKKQ